MLTKPEIGGVSPSEPEPRLTITGARILGQLRMHLGTLIPIKSIPFFNLHPKQLSVKSHLWMVWAFRNGNVRANQLCGPSGKLCDLPDSQDGEGIFTGEGGPSSNSLSSSRSLSRIMRGTPFKVRGAIWCSSGRSKLSKSNSGRKHFVRAAASDAVGGQYGEPRAPGAPRGQKYFIASF